MAAYVDNYTNDNQSSTKTSGVLSNQTLRHAVHLAMLAASYLLVRRVNRYFENPYFGSAATAVADPLAGVLVDCETAFLVAFNRFLGRCRPHFISAHADIKGRLLELSEITMDSPRDVSISAPLVSQSENPRFFFSFFLSPFFNKVF